MALQLLDDSGRFVAAPRFFGTVEEHVCVLILFDGYSTAGCRLAYDRRWIVQQLLATAPFREFYQRGRSQRVRGGLLLFSAVVPPTVPLRYGLGPACNGDLPEVDVTAFENFVAGLSFPGFLQGRAVWLENSSRSHGLVGVVLNEFWGRDNHQGNYFTVTGQREEMAITFVHELGHGLELADEYEDFALVNSCTQTGSFRAPNVVSRDAIEVGAHPPATTPLDPLGLQLDRIPWAQYLADPPLVVDHPKRPDFARGSTSFDCNVGDLLEAQGQGPQSRIGLWEGAHYHSFNAFRAEPYCVMRNHRAEVRDPHPPIQITNDPTSRFLITFGEVELIPIPGTDPPAPACGVDPDLRSDGEPTRFEQYAANSYVPFCRICEQWIRYRFGLPDVSDVDEWRPGQTLETRIDAFQRWLGRHG
jgi:hypothetical protein